MSQSSAAFNSPKRGRPKAPAAAELDLVCAALAHPARRQILEELQRDGEATALTLARRHASVKAALAHLRVLVEAGLVEYRRGAAEGASGDGRQHHYRVVPQQLELVELWSGRFRVKAELAKEEARRKSQPVPTQLAEQPPALPIEALDGTLIHIAPYTPQAARFVEGALGYRDLWRYTTTPMDTVADAQQYVARALIGQHQGRLVAFGIFARPGVGSVEQLTFAGSSRLVRTDPQYDGYEIGWTWLLPQFQGTGVNAEAKLLLLTLAFEQLGARRVYFKGDARNAQSRAALEKLGAQFEGVLRSHITLPDGSMRDSFMFSIIPSEWPGVKARLKERVTAAASAMIP